MPNGKPQLCARVDDDERLRIEAAQLDRGRFAELYEEYFARVYAFIVRRVRDRDDAQDLTSEVFHHALRNLSRFEWRGVPFSAWLYKIAANAIADHMRKATRETPAPDLDPPGAGALDEVESRARLFRLVDQLPADQRRVIILRFAEQISIADVARQLGKSEGAIKQLQFRGLKNLRIRMASINA
ncbi:MAG TPA: RNA polymerase sigma factor [Candidatus Binataceae bacterium]|nr:RNA polymerase sigma factor [Candidatus Binataceae bacterium]